MKHVTMMGAVWKMSDRNFKKLAKELKDNHGSVEDIEVYGTMIVDRLYALDEVVQAAGLEDDDG